MKNVIEIEALHSLCANSLMEYRHFKCDGLTIKANEAMQKYLYHFENLLKLTPVNDMVNELAEREPCFG